MGQNIRTRIKQAARVRRKKRLKASARAEEAKYKKAKSAS
jgi:hypothetical protein